MNLLHKTETFNQESSEDEESLKQLDSIVKMAKIDDPYDEIIKDFLVKGDVKKVKVDLKYYMMSLVCNKLMTAQSKKMIEYVVKMTESCTPKDENLNLELNYMRQRQLP